MKRKPTLSLYLIFLGIWAILTSNKLQINRSRGRKCSRLKENLTFKFARLKTHARVHWGSARALRSAMGHSGYVKTLAKAFVRAQTRTAEHRAVPAGQQPSRLNFDLDHLCKSICARARVYVSEFYACGSRVMPNSVLGTGLNPKPTRFSPIPAEAAELSSS